MSTIYPASDSEERLEPRREKRRSAWRTRLIEAERGFSVSFRSGSALYVHIFFGLVIMITGMTFGLRFWGWAALIVAMACGIAAELFYHAIRLLALNFDTDEAEQAVKLSAAGMVMALVGAGTVIVFVLGSRLMLILS